MSFDHVSHAWVVQFVEYRSGDTRVVRLIQQWLKAGVLAEGGWTQTDEEGPQGGLISPVLANL
jgi:RNA-directed DNA polymerase